MTFKSASASEVARAIEDRYIAGELAAYGFVRPPWQYRADEGPTSVCWRMGGGEDHRWAFIAWWESLAPSEPERIAWVRRWEPPAIWWAWAALLIWPGADDEEGRGAAEDEEASLELRLVERLAAIGIGSVSEWHAGVQRYIDRLDAEIAEMEAARERRAAALEAGLAGEQDETE